MTTNTKVVVINTYQGCGNIFDGTWVTLEFGIWLLGIDSLNYHDSQFKEHSTASVCIGCGAFSESPDYEFYLDKFLHHY